MAITSILELTSNADGRDTTTLLAIEQALNLLITQQTEEEEEYYFEYDLSSHFIGMGVLQQQRIIKKIKDTFYLSGYRCKFISDTMLSLSWKIAGQG